MSPMQDEVVEADPERARNAAAGQGLDGRAHRGREDEREEEERAENPELPQCEREHDDPPDDEGRDGGLLGGLGHGE